MTVSSNNVINKMKNKLLSRIFSYRPRENHNPKENFVTEVLAYSLNQDPKFNQAFLGLIQNKLKNALSIPKSQSYKWDTQFRFNSGNIPDLVLLDSGIPRIIIEVKVDSSLGEKQIERYKQEAKKISPTVPVIMIGKDNYQNTQSADAFISWTEIYSVMSSIQAGSSQIGSWLLEEFVDLLKTIEIIEMPIYKDEILNYSANYFKFKKLYSIINKTFGILGSGNENGLTFKPPFLSPKYYSRFGIEGLRWAKDTNIHNPNCWTPSVFMGIVTDPYDHALDDICKDEIPFIIVISINEFLYSSLQQIEEWKIFRDSVRASLSSAWNVLDRTEFSLNPWHPFILYKPLSELFPNKEPISIEKAIENTIKEMIPIIQAAFDNSRISIKLEELFKNKEK